LLQGPHNPLRGQTSIDFDGQRFPHAFIKDVECPETPPLVQTVAHEIQ
jgi:hypothetical protein